MCRATISITIQTVTFLSKCWLAGMIIGWDLTKRKKFWKRDILTAFKNHGAKKIFMYLNYVCFIYFFFFFNFK